MKRVFLLLAAACVAAFGIMLASASTSSATINCGWSEETIAGQGGDYTKMPKDNPGRVYTPCPSTPKPTPVPPQPKPKPVVPKPKPPKPVAPSVPQPSVPNVTPAGNPNPAPARPSVKTPKKKKGPQPVVYGSVGEGAIQAATEPPCLVPATEDSFPWWLLIVGAGLGIIGDRLFIAAARRKNAEEGGQEPETSEQETDTAPSEDADVAGFTTTK